jgi:hypothetical protein
MIVFKLLLDNYYFNYCSKAITLVVVDVVQSKRNDQVSFIPCMFYFRLHKQM